jgi:ABC-type transport system substrate-binding protein
MIPGRDPQATRKRLSRHPLWLAAAAVAVALAAAACGGSSSSGGGEVKEGGVFRLGSNSTIDSLNPFVAFNSDAWSTFEYIYPMLDQYNPKLQFVPDFARSWQHSPDGKVWTFHTRPNAKWSDGKPLTAADVAWTLSTNIKFQNGPTANTAGTIACEGVERHHSGGDLQAAGRERPFPAPAGADSARAHLGEVRGR